MRTVKELSQMDGRVYVFVKNSPTTTRFLTDAEKEGFTFGDSVKPTERQEQSDIYAINLNGTINFVGFAGHMAFHHSDHIGNEPLIKVDYAKYVEGDTNYLIKS